MESRRSSQCQGALAFPLVPPCLSPEGLLIFSFDPSSSCLRLASVAAQHTSPANMVSSVLVGLTSPPAAIVSVVVGVDFSPAAACSFDAALIPSSATDLFDVEAGGIFVVVADLSSSSICAPISIAVSTLASARVLVVLIVYDGVALLEAAASQLGHAGSVAAVLVCKD